MNEGDEGKPKRKPKRPHPQLAAPDLNNNHTIRDDITGNGGILVQYDISPAAQSLYNHLLTAHCFTLSVDCMQRGLLSTLPCPHCRGKCWRMCTRNGYDIHSNKISTFMGGGGGQRGKQRRARQAALGNVNASASDDDETAKNLTDERINNDDTQLMINNTVPCTNCGKTVLINRFAPHLERCLGLQSAETPSFDKKRYQTYIQLSLILFFLSFSFLLIFVGEQLRSWQLPSPKYTLQIMS